jgi:UDP-N-acetylglucosamine acyltransferase
MTQIHSSAVIDKHAQLGNDVEIGPFCVVGPDVTIHAGAKLMSHVVLDGNTTIGEKCNIFPFASIGTQTQDLKFNGGKTFVDIGAGTTLREYVTVNSATEDGEYTRVGEGCHIMAYSHIAHACQIGNGVIMSNSTHLAGHIVIEDLVVIGGLCGIHQFVRIGTMCMVGGMSRISQDCPPYMMVVGNPEPEVKGLNSIGLKRRGVTPEARSILKQALKILFRDGLSTSQALEKIESELDDNSEVSHLVEFVKNSERGICK